MTRSTTERMEVRPIRWEVWDGVSILNVGRKNTLAVIIVTFFSERDAKHYARSQGRDHVWRVTPHSKEKRERLNVRPARVKAGGA